VGRLHHQAGQRSAHRSAGRKRCFRHHASARAPAGDTYYFSGFLADSPYPGATYVWAPSTVMLPGTIVQDDTAPIPNIEVTFGGGTTVPRACLDHSRAHLYL